MGICNANVGCCPQCGSIPCCPPLKISTQLDITFVAGTDTGFTITAVWNAALGIWVASWTSSCGQLIQICLSCDAGGIAPPQLTCPNAPGCNEQCCGPTVNGTLERTCNPLFAEYIMTMVHDGLSCCPNPCKGGSSWTVQITEH
jgi:hypothetical protein